MTTVMDQASPWFTPRSAFAATTTAQLGATPMSTGTGSASSQPMTSRRLRPTRVASEPAARFVTAFAAPNATMKESTAALDVRSKSSSPTSGSVERSSPTIAPTKALRTTSSANCGVFSRSPSFTPPCAIRLTRGGSGRAAAVGGDDRRLVRRRGREVLHQRRHELVLAEPEQRIVQPLEADRRGRVRRQTTPTHGSRVVRGVEQHVVGEREELVLQRAVEDPGHVLGRAVAAGVQVGTAGITDQKRVA